MELIVDETNRYQRFLVDTLGNAAPKYLRKFAQVTLEEIHSEKKNVLLSIYVKSIKCKNDMIC